MPSTTFLPDPAAAPWRSRALPFSAQALAADEVSLYTTREPS